MRSTPKMKMKTRGLFALVEGECDWVVFTGRNYKVFLFIKNLEQDALLKVGGDDNHSKKFFLLQIFRTGL